MAQPQEAMGGQPAVAEPAGQPAAAAPPPAQQWQPTEQWGRQIDSFIQTAGPTLDALQQILYAEPEPEPIQPGEDGSYTQEQLDQLINQRVQDQLGAFMPLLGQIAEDRGEQMAKAELTKLKAEIGDFNDDVAVNTALGFMQRGMDGQQALRAAATLAFQANEAARKQAVEEYQKSLGAASTAQGQAGIGGAALEMPGTPKGNGRYEAVIQNMLGRMNPSTDGT